MGVEIGVVVVEELGVWGGDVDDWVTVNWVCVVLPVVSSVTVNP